MNEFFIRFNLQDMVFSFQTEDFYNEQKMQASKEDVDKFIEDCKNWQREKAEILKSEIDLSPVSGKKILYIGDNELDIETDSKFSKERLGIINKFKNIQINRLLGHKVQFSFTEYNTSSLLFKASSAADV